MRKDMSPIDELIAELESEKRAREDEYLVKERADKKEEILQLERIEFSRPLLENELRKHLIPYLQDNSINARLVLDPTNDSTDESEIRGELANGNSRVKLKFIPSYDGHNRAVYFAIDFYPNKEEVLPESIIKGMRDARDNITKYFNDAGIVGRGLQKPKFPSYR